MTNERRSDLQDSLILDKGLREAENPSAPALFTLTSQSHAPGGRARQTPLLSLARKGIVFKRPGRLAPQVLDPKVGARQVCGGSQQDVVNFVRVS
jgi:hypothetical protein